MEDPETCVPWEFVCSGSFDYVFCLDLGGGVGSHVLFVTRSLPYRQNVRSFILRLDKGLFRGFSSIDFLHVRFQSRLLPSDPCRIIKLSTQNQIPIACIFERKMV